MDLQGFQPAEFSDSNRANQRTPTARAARTERDVHILLDSDGLM
jgi:hypothetical protein